LEPTPSEGADYWRGLYEACSARIQDPVAVQNAVDLAQAALTMSREFGRPFREVHTALLEGVYRQRPRRKR
jgi:hypothetical protein